jgi:hypothetical protein
VKASWPAIANGKPGAIEAIMPVPVNLWPGRNIRLRAAKCVFAPQSNEITASSAIKSLTALITICGRRGEREVASTCPSRRFQLVMRLCASSRKLRSD